MGVLRVISSRGDEQIIWKRHQVDVGDPEALAAIREAERIFQQQLARGATAFTIERGSAPARIDRFDAQAEQIVLAPRVAGG